jgi:hypothetical protein
MFRDRDFKTFGPRAPAKRRLHGRWGRRVSREGIGLFDCGLSISLKWQGGLEVSSHAAVAADTIGMKPVGRLAPPLRFHSEVALRGSDHTT